VKIGQYLAKIWTKYDSWLFWGHPVQPQNSHGDRLRAGQLHRSAGKWALLRRFPATLGCHRRISTE